MGERLGANSTVLWVKAPGLYRCRVTHNITHTECLTSTNISDWTPSYKVVITRCFQLILCDCFPYILSAECSRSHIQGEQASESYVIQEEEDRRPDSGTLRAQYHLTGPKYVVTLMMVTGVSKPLSGSIHSSQFRQSTVVPMVEGEPMYTMCYT